jgi:hypothetical protein
MSTGIIVDAIQSNSIRAFLLIGEYFYKIANP